MGARDGYQPLRPLGKAIIVLLGIDIALGVVGSLATVGYIGHLNALIERDGRSAMLDDTAPLETVEIVQMLSAFASLMMFLALAVLIGIWIHRAAWNVRHLGATGLRYTPGWCVGWYFVPFANLVVPYRAMKEIWQASADPLHRQRPAPEILGGWWALWLGCNLAGNASTRIYLRADSLAGYLTSEWFGLLSTVLGLGLSAIFIVIVRNLAGVQESTLARRDQGTPADPDPAPDARLHV